MAKAVVRRLVAGALAIALVAMVAGLGAALVPRLFGYSTLVVMSGSMGPTAPTGSLVIGRWKSADEVRVGDVILVERTAAGEERPDLLHRVVSLERSGGRTVARTQGDANANPDPDPYSLLPRVLTQVSALPYVGFLAFSLNTPLGWLLLVGLAGAVALATLRDVWTSKQPAAEEVSRSQEPKVTLDLGRRRRVRRRLAEIEERSAAALQTVAEIEERNARLVAADVELAAREEQLSALQERSAALEERSSRVAAAEVEFDERERRLAELEVAQEQASAVRALQRDELRRQSSALAQTITELEERSAKLAAAEAEVEERRRRLAAAEAELAERERRHAELEAAQRQAEEPPSSHLLFLPTDRGYALVECEGAPPSVGSEVDVGMNGTRFVVSKVGPSPLALGGPRCAYLLRLT